MQQLLGSGAEDKWTQQAGPEHDLGPSPFGGADETAKAQN